MSVVYQGYLETSYLNGPEGYLGGNATVSVGMQATIKVNRTKTLAVQSRVVVDRLKVLAFQGRILTAGDPGLVPMQVSVDTKKAFPFGMQARILSNNGAKNFAFATSVSKLWHISCPAYLVEPYLTQPYHSGCIKVPVGLQANIVGRNTKRFGFQSSVTISKTVSLPLQSRLTITQTNFAAMQATLSGIKYHAFQTRIVLYNTTNLRILTDFLNRGTNGITWTATSTQAGDFSPNNLNTDIVEQVWRTANGAITNVEIVCDTQVPQGVFVDTLAILGHNFSGSATVFFDGSNDIAFNTLETVPVSLEREPNAYWIAPVQPLTSYRYWRLRISDSGNQDGFIRIGTVVFGSSVIFSGECFTDVVKFGRKQFTDSVFTEGFTNVKNDRGQKKNLALDFKNLEFNRGNFKNIRSIIEKQSTILKSLWIPTPQYPSRFALFGKMTELPSESHNDRGAGHDYVDVAINVDEAE
jgi:hypothetical protein